MRKILIILLFFISSCKNKPPHFQPESEYLPNANVNKEYVAFIFIAGGAIGKESINVIITPDNSGLTWKPEMRLLSYGEVQKNYHRISIIGKPERIKEISALVHGYTYGTMVPGVDFNRRYKIKVLD